MKNILKILIINVIMNYIISLFRNTYIGDFNFEMNISFIFKSIVLLLLIFQILFTYYFSNLKINIKPIKIKHNVYKKYSILVFLLIIINIFIVYKYKIGIAGKSIKNNYTFILNLFGVDAFFYIYYLLTLKYDKRNIFFYFTLVFYIILKILQGWTGDIYTIFLIGIYYFYKKHKKIINVEYIYLLTLLLGARIYQYVYPLKNLIRLGILYPISYIDALYKLLGRLTPYYNLLFYFQNSNQITEYINMNLVRFSHIKDIMRRVIPSFIYRNKEFDTINSLFLKSIYGEQSLGSVDVTYIGNLIITLKYSFFEFIINIMLFIILTSIIIYLLKRIDNECFKIYFFVIMNGLMVSGSFAVSYALLIINLIVINIIFKILNIKYI